MKRAVGYCETVKCEDYAKGVFLLNHGNTFLCPRCRAEGSVVPERGSYTGTSGVFKEVRVEFCYCAVYHKYDAIAVVRDESLWGRCSTYVLQSPLIKTEQRALKVAEAVLSNLNKYSQMFDLDKGDIPSSTETWLTFDMPRDEFKVKLDELAEELAKSPLARMEGGR